VDARARRPPMRRDLRLQQKGPAGPLTTCSAHEDRPRRDRDLEETADPNRPQQRRTALNVVRELEQNLTPFRGPKTSAPDLLTRPSNMDANKIDSRSLTTGIDAGQGGTPMRRVPPCQPSGRQDLNLRLLDPQRRPATPPRPY
jgi:hypothetical protein